MKSKKQSGKSNSKQQTGTREKQETQSNLVTFDETENYLETAQESQLQLEDGDFSSFVQNLSQTNQQQIMNMNYEQFKTFTENDFSDFQKSNIEKPQQVQEGRMIMGNRNIGAGFGGISKEQFLQLKLQLQQQHMEYQDEMINQQQDEIDELSDYSQKQKQQYQQAYYKDQSIQYSQSQTKKKKKVIEDSFTIKSIVRPKTDKSVSTKLNQSKAASNNYFNRFHKQSEPSLLITEDASRQDVEDFNDELEDDNNESKKSILTRTSQKTQLVVKQQTEEDWYDKMAKDQTIQLSAIFENFESSKEKNLGKWGASMLWIVGKKEKSYDVDKITHLQDLNEYITKFEVLPPKVFIMTVVCTQQNTFVLSTNGKVYSWGNDTPVLGRDIYSKGDGYLPNEILTFKDKVVCLAGGNNHMLALDIKKRVYSWGTNNVGQLGHGVDKALDKTLDKEHPTLIQYFKKTKVVQIYASFDSSYVISNQSVCFAWGNNSDGQLGISGIAYFTEPMIMLTMPWNVERELKIFKSKQNRGHVIQSEMSKNMDHHIVSLEYKVKTLQYQAYHNQSKLIQLQKQAAYYENKIFRKPNIKEDLDVLNDDIINEIMILANDKQKQKKQVDQEIDEEETKIQGIDQVIDENEIELEKLQKEWKQILLRKDDHEVMIQRKNNKNKVTKELEILKVKQNELKEQMHMNEYHRSNLQELLQQKFMEKNDRKQKLEVLRQKMQIYGDQTFVYEKLYHNRFQEVSIKNGLLMKQALEKKIYTIYQFFQALKETSIENLVENGNNHKSLEEILNESNRSISKLKIENDSMNTDTSDFNYQTINYVHKIFEDNIRLRRLINEFIKGILTQTSNRFEEQLKNKQKQYYKQNASKFDESQTRSSHLKEHGQSEKKKKESLVKSTKMKQGASRVKLETDKRVCGFL